MAKFLVKALRTILENSRYNLIYALLKKFDAFNQVPSYVVALSLLNADDPAELANAIELEAEDWSYYRAIFNNDLVIEEHSTDPVILKNLEQFIGIAAALGRTEILQALMMREETEVFSLFPTPAYDNIISSLKPIDKLCLPPLFLAANLNKLESLKAYFDRFPEDTNRLYPTLLYAAVSGRVEVAAWTLENGARITCWDSFQLNALHHAARAGHTELVQWLVGRGMDVNATDDMENMAAIHFAAQGGYFEMMCWLLENGASAQDKDYTGMTPLHYAAACGHVKLAQYLLDHGADVNDKDNDGKTALHRAAESGHVNLLQLLVNNRANIYARTSSDETVLHSAAKSNSDEAVEFLLANAATLLRSSSQDLRKTLIMG